VEILAIWPCLYSSGASADSFTYYAVIIEYRSVLSRIVKMCGVQMETFHAFRLAAVITLATYIGKRNASIWRLSVCLSYLFLTLIGHVRWWFGVVVTRWSQSTRLTLAEPG